MTTPQAIINRLGANGILTPADIPAITSCRGRVLYFMSDGAWHPASAILAAGRGTESLRRLRELRNLPGYTLQRKRNGKSRDFLYRLVKV